MYANLKIEMMLKKISIEDIADTIGVHRNSVSNKINGGNFTVEEAFKISEAFFPDKDLQYLFKKLKQ
jgi:plasmid maintenance system antidote protein VapI